MGNGHASFVAIRKILWGSLIMQNVITLSS